MTVPVDPDRVDHHRPCGHKGIIGRDGNGNSDGMAASQYKRNGGLTQRSNHFRNCKPGFYITSHRIQENQNAFDLVVLDRCQLRKNMFVFCCFGIGRKTFNDPRSLRSQKSDGFGLPFLPHRIPGDFLCHFLFFLLALSLSSFYLVSDIAVFFTVLPELSFL